MRSRSAIQTPVTVVCFFNSHATACFSRQVLFMPRSSTSGRLTARGHPLEVPVKHKTPFHSRFPTAFQCFLFVDRPTLLSIAERLLPSGSSSRGCSVTHLDPGYRRRRQPPALCAASASAIAEPENLLFPPTAHSVNLVSLAGFQTLGGWGRGNRVPVDERGCRRVPISPVVLPNPFPVSGGGPFIQTSVFRQSPLRSLRAIRPWPACRPAPSWPWVRRFSPSSARTRRGCAG